MSTLRVAAINNPAASSGGLAISAAGNVTGAGLDLIAAQSFSAVSSVSLNNVFSATYANYRLLIAAIGSAGADLKMRLRVSGSDNSTSNYSSTQIRGVNSAVNVSTLSAQSSLNIGAVRSSGKSDVSADIFAPYLAESTHANLLNNDAEPSINIYRCNHAVASSFDGFTVFPSTGTITGTIRVYGYKDL